MGSKFISTSCPTCKVAFAVTKDFYTESQVDKITVYCPNGCALHFRTERNFREEFAQVSAEKLKLEIELKKVKDYNNSLVSKLDQLEAKLEEKK